MGKKSFSLVWDQFKSYVFFCVHTHYVRLYFEELSDLFKIMKSHNREGKERASKKKIIFIILMTQHVGIFYVFAKIIILK